MIFDFSAAASRLKNRRFDVCIVGSGPAAITVARTLAANRKSVVLLEGGGLEHSEQSADIYEGESVGFQYWGLSACRLRYFGGTSNHWTGRCGLFDDVDFEERDYFGLPGWPIEPEQVVKHLPAAKSILDLGIQDLSSPSDPNWRSELFKFSVAAFSPPTRFGEKYKDELKQSKSIEVYLNANVTEIRLSENFNHSTGVLVQDFQGRETAVSADAYVLGCGAIENARILLNSDSQVTHGIGNHSDFVGRCFMEHFNVPMGRFLITQEEFWSNQDGSDRSDVRQLAVSPSARLMRSKDIGNSVIAFNPSVNPRSYGRLAPLRQIARNAVCASDAFTTAGRFLWDFDCPGDGVITTLCEQAPNRDSRITLGTNRDALGLRRVQLDWRINDSDRRTVRTLALEIAKEMARLDLARVQLSSFILDESEEIEIGHHCHHIGTTRMADDKMFGVVDPNCKVHGIENLYVAGSSVFPTGGGINPTLTIVMLSARLGEHIAEVH